MMLAISLFIISAVATKKQSTINDQKNRAVVTATVTVSTSNSAGLMFFGLLVISFGVFLIEQKEVE